MSKEIKIASTAEFNEPLEAGLKAGCGVVVMSSDGEKILLGKRAKKNKEGFETWCFPGGSIESGETPIEGAKRELFEETGLTAVNIQPIASVYIKSTREHVFFADKVSGIMKAKEDEISELRWVAIECMIGIPWFEPSRVSWEIFKQFLPKIQKGEL